MRRFLRAIGFSCFSRRKERRDTSAALRAITIEDARYTFQQNLLDDDVSTVYSSHYDGNDYLSIQQRQQLQFVLFGGTEHSSSFQPEQIGPRDITVGPIRLSDIRADMNDRQLPVFFTPSPPDSFGISTAKDGFINLGDLSRLQATAH
ncbi:hypothetical protein Poli38472_002624 [Pythium oligandrum]|uniref:Uncharacterized protein n=1 Tax=Pythium oligandrum TaxID=41045 RepID=A0A8K1CJR0_PYTOL|nr:hypothetical protein Poli38472_002624 [Pythium oligandrum]|eukprot:TMW63683.1 hypothetical protein Poli38472_002624 [Pythium oligandrum]